MTNTDKFDAPQGVPFHEQYLRAVSEGIHGAGVTEAGGMEVTAAADGSGVTVASGELWYPRQRFTLEEDVTIEASTGDADHDRWDAVVFDTDVGEPVYHEGEPEEYPEPPAIGDNEFPLAFVYVPPESGIADEHVLNWRSAATKVSNVMVDAITIDSDYTTAGEQFVFCDTADEPLEVTLAESDMQDGTVIQVIDTAGAAATNEIVVAAEGEETTIDGDEDVDIRTAWGALSFVSDGDGWYTAGGGTGAGGGGFGTSGLYEGVLERSERRLLTTIPDVEDDEGELAEFVEVSADAVSLSSLIDTTDDVSITYGSYESGEFDRLGTILAGDGKAVEAEDVSVSSDGGGSIGVTVENLADRYRYVRAVVEGVFGDPDEPDGPLTYDEEYIIVGSRWHDLQETMVVRRIDLEDGSTEWETAKSYGEDVGLRLYSGITINDDIAYPIVNDDTVDEAGDYLLGIDVSDGSLVHEVELPGPARTPLVFTGENAVIGTGDMGEYQDTPGQITAYDPSDDFSEVWTYEPPEIEEGSPRDIAHGLSVHDGTIYASAGESWDSGMVCAVDVSDGSEIWATDLNDEIPEADGLIDASTIPIVHDGMVVGVSRGADFAWALDSQTGEVEWSTEVDSGGGKSLCVSDGLMFFGSSRWGAEFYALDVSTGDIEWNIELDGSTLAPPVASENQVYVTDDTPHIQALDKETGDVEWDVVEDSWSQINHTSIIGDKFIYPLSGDGELVARDRNDGSELWRADMDGADGYVLSPSNSHGKTRRNMPGVYNRNPDFLNQEW